MLKAVLYLAVLGLMVQWTQIMGNPGDRRSIRPQLYSEQQYEINKNDPRSDWFYSRSSRSLPPFSWSFFKDEDDEDTLIKKRLDTLEKKQKELVELMKKLQQGEPTGGRTNAIENRNDSESMESVKVNVAHEITDDSGSSENESLGSLENFGNSDIKKSAREEISFLKIESKDQNNKRLPVSQNTSRVLITNDPLTKISQDYGKDQTNTGSTNTIMLPKSNLGALVPITNPTEGNNFPEPPKESYQNFHQEKESSPVLTDNNKSSVQDPSVNWKGLASSYSNPASPDSKGPQIKDTEVSLRNQNATQNTDDQSALRFGQAGPVKPNHILGEFLSNDKEKNGTRMEHIKLSKDFEKVHDVLHNFEKNKNLFKTLTHLEKTNENKKNTPYAFFESLNKQIKSNPLVAEADKIFHTGPTTKGCAPCPETKKEEKPTCVPTIAKQGEKEEVPQKDKVPSTPSVSSPTVTNTENTTDKKKDDGTEKPVIKGPEETEEKKPEEPPKEIND
ncbi:myb-like protein X isoform X1 [Cephus cinctus]|uniref:Myb-like protein X isoform X1 n=1 Tax=Cephus cinctus TaxID=211228 RepID=A0AAJ7C3F0_CEPCN|nr:myb-like protein X isoform X1 [Cephus cinctus]